MNNAYEILLDEAGGWVDLYNTDDANFIDLVRSECLRRFRENTEFAKSLAKEIAHAQYRVDSFMEELAKAAIRFADE
jgi:hypothetical protein